jgi:DNA-binding transcriptional regulator YhcF (GntR family)
VHFRVDPHCLTPPSQQIVASVLDAIANGELQPGDRLPSVRGLAARALVNPNTVAKAWRDLEHLGATEGRNGSGVYVTAAGPEVARAIRLTETLDQFRAAVEQALRAGHEEQDLLAVLAAQRTASGTGERR